MSQLSPALHKLVQEALDGHYEAGREYNGAADAGLVRLRYCSVTDRPLYEALEKLEIEQGKLKSRLVFAGWASGYHRETVEYCLDAIQVVRMNNTGIPSDSTDAEFQANARGWKGACDRLELILKSTLSPSETEQDLKFPMADPAIGGGPVT